MTKRHQIRHPLYCIWRGMFRRCSGKPRGCGTYKSKGITVCSRWSLGEDGLTAFECFIADMGPRPTPHHSLDRIDNDGDYEPSNCRWATAKEQQRNKSDNLVIVFRGAKMTLAEAIEISGLPASTPRVRIRRGWSIEEALTTPIRGIRQ